MRSRQSGFLALFALCGAVFAVIIGAAYGFADIKDKIGQKTVAPYPAKNIIVPADRVEPVSGAAAAKAPSVPPLAGATNGADSAAPAGKRKILAGAEGNARGILNGYKGYRYHRPGYKSAGDGWWYPRAAFAPKSSVAPFMQRPGKPVKTAPAGKKPKGGRAGAQRSSAAPVLTTAHKAWCAGHYPNYRPDDNSYTITAGRRRVCLSPYME
ncbi:MAG: BA14K family protein [Candidatus Tokpelaia sp.]|uniref:BA14K family protein n=1 Tax=Candidatus Tokpelaia sp. TaxID=2233777 RepID=UPI00123852D1|nr:BA14K family protein [Candidatus Tokpelaia sp.]KAA6204659.1 MAG: BA14K family protein [Candidatus Tokpelaia sp.]KAA6206107.1 MAG: BA14K family protein [Candidatus Tokpelaia sp.]KAA6405715.1 hypothetical protein DPQ22_03420 [Candidatus Tokpelaia sp.]